MITPDIIDRLNTIDNRNKQTSPDTNGPTTPSDTLRYIRILLNQADEHWSATKIMTITDTIKGEPVHKIHINPNDLLILEEIAAISLRCLDTWGTTAYIITNNYPTNNHPR